MASGEGSRLKELSRILGCPKHLFSIANKTVAGRIASELSQCCNQVICITQNHHVHKFEQEFKKLPFPVEIISKKHDGFKGDFECASEKARYDHVIVTVGDIIFPEHEIINFAIKTQKKRDKFIVAFDKGQLTKFDLRMVMFATTKTMLKEIVDLNPESYLEVIKRAFYYLLKNKTRFAFVKTLFNINTPEAYLAAKKHFE